MTNNAFHRLCNEYSYNVNVNNECIGWCKANGVDIYSDYPAVNDMKAARNYCKKMGVWLEDCLEEGIYLELKPFGEDYSDFTTIRKALREFRKSFKRQSDYDNIIIKYAA